MIAFFVLCLFLNFFADFSILEFAQDLSTPFHHKCLSWITLENHGSEIRRALLCGENITSPDLDLQLKSLGLIHLVVVSGSHLEFLSRILNLLKAPPRLIQLLLFIFLLLSNFQAPAVRCFVDLLFREKVRHHSVFWSGLLCLCLFPAWISSLSFWMSLCASLVIRLPGTLLNKDSPLHELHSQAVIYFFFLPITLFLTPIGPVSIFNNLIFSSWLGAFWIPLAVFPQSEVLFQWLLILSPEGSSGAYPKPSFQIFLIFLIFYTGVLLCFEMYRSCLRRRSCF